MRRIDLLVGLGALVAGALGAQAGCVIGNGSKDCSAFPDQTACGLGTGGGTSTGTMSSSTGGAPPVECTGDPTLPMDMGTMKTGNIRDECAVFVSTTGMDTMGCGTMESPCKTLKQALGATSGAKNKVFACKMGAFMESVTIASKVEVYGGFDCAPKQWTWAATDRSEIDGVADAAAVTMTVAADGALLSGFTIKGAAPMTGTSSYGVIVADMPMNGVKIEQCDISAAAAVVGPDGTTPTMMVAPGQNATTDHMRMDACINPGQLEAGPPGMVMCGTTDVSGGAGGKGGITMGMASPGGMGTNGNPNMGTMGQGGAGQPTPGQNCQAGTAGQDGSTGMNGTAGAGVSASITGLSGGDGGNGGVGTPGQGGGGGGGAMSGTFCPGNTDGNGASGGGGGSGGCGGNGGFGGKGGGSSIAILSLGTKLTIDGNSVTLTSHNAGAGGKGAAGQSGALGGGGAMGGASSGISPSKAGCQGGSGGTGGDGGPGGGGRGGFSAGVGWAKGPPTPAPTFKTPPMVGTKGMGGTAANGGNPGADGAAGAICDFSGMTPKCM